MKTKRPFWVRVKDFVRRPPSQVVTVFPRGTVVKYRGLPCELLQDTPYHTETIQRQADADRACAPNNEDIQQ